MGRLKLDRLNMKVIIAIGVGIILIITALFLIFRTNLIVKHNPTVDESTISEEAKKRTKNKDDLNIAEKKYVIEENVKEALENNPELQEKCKDGCTLDLDDFLLYQGGSNGSGGSGGSSGSGGNSSNPSGSSENPESGSNSSSNTPGGTSNSSSNHVIEDDVYVDGCTGKIVVSGGVVDMSGVSCSSKNTSAGNLPNQSNSNGSLDNSSENSSSNSLSNSSSNSSSNPSLEDPEEPTESGSISQAAKDRTKNVSELTVAEKKYIIKENMKNIYKDNAEVKRLCNSSSPSAQCKVKVEEYFVGYSTDYDKGFVVKNCTGEVTIRYNASRGEFIADDDAIKNVVCKLG